MKIPTLPFTLTDWDEVPEERYEGETGYALWRTLNIEDVRVRRVEYSKNYLADHWCDRGHILFVYEGVLDTELKLDGAINGQAGRDVIVGIRPEHVTLTKEKSASALPISLDLVEPLGSEALLHARLGDQNMVFKADTNGDIGHLSGVSEVYVPSHLIKLFDAETGLAMNLGA